MTLLGFIFFFAAVGVVMQILFDDRPAAYDAARSARRAEGRRQWIAMGKTIGVLIVGPGLILWLLVAFLGH